MSENQKLYLLDGMALLYRAHFAFIRNPIITSNGVNTSAVFGFTNNILQIIKEEQPTHLAIAFDLPAPTHRHKEFPDYKANREAMPEDLSDAIPVARRMAEAFRIPIVAKEGYEADDVIGTLAKKAEQAGMTTYMVTPDKDFCQLVTEHTFLYRPGRGGGDPEKWGISEVLEKFGIERVDQVIDILGLAGDKSDNIPGVPGVGEKTAQKLIGQFGSVENVLKNVDQLKGKQKERVEENKEQALLSKRLVTIVTDVPVETDLESFKLQKFDEENLKQLFSELEFAAIARRLFDDSPTPKQSSLFPEPETAPAEAPEERATQQELLFKDLKTIHQVAHDYRPITTIEERKKLTADLGKQKSFCFDLETTSLDIKTAGIVGLAISFEAHTGFFISFPEDRDEALAILDDFRSVFEDPNIEKIGHNVKFDIGVLRWYGVPVLGPLFDTMLAHYALEPEMRHGMDTLANTYLEYAPISIASLIGERGAEQKSMREVGLAQLTDYAAEDADITFQLKLKLDQELKEKNLESLCRKVEFPLVPSLVEMEYSGITLDSDALNEYSSRLAIEIGHLEGVIYEAAGEVFNLNSPKQMGQIFFDKLKLDSKAKKTRTGQYATNEQVLSRLANKHKIVRDVLNYRTLTKLKSVYVDQLPGCVFKKSGRIHTTYNQAVTSTGRMQSHDPNLQNIPIRTEEGREIRKAFIPRGEEFVLLAADYSQIELRIIAELSGDENMQSAFINEVDIHSMTAARVNLVEMEEVTDEMRRKAKMVSFGIIYGISAFGLSQRLNILRSEASDIIESYFEQYPGVRQYMNDTIDSARQHGYVETVMGRRRYLRDINSRNATLRGAAERNAINSPIQGTAADMIKIAMAKIHRKLIEGGCQTRMLIQVHDELVFDLYREEKNEILQMVEHEMKVAIPMKVPMVVEMGIGGNWLEAH